mgnify:CR=1 FL=1
MFRVASNCAGHLSIDLTLGKTGIKTKPKMFEDIFTNQGFNRITEKILHNLDVKSLLRCRLVCKALHQFIKSFEKSSRVSPQIPFTAPNFVAARARLLGYRNHMGRRICPKEARAAVRAAMHHAFLMGKTNQIESIFIIHRLLTHFL